MLEWCHLLYTRIRYQSHSFSWIQFIPLFQSIFQSSDYRHPTSDMCNIIVTVSKYWDIIAIYHIHSSDIPLLKLKYKSVQIKSSIVQSTAECYLCLASELHSIGAFTFHFESGCCYSLVPRPQPSFFHLQYTQTHKGGEFPCLSVLQAMNKWVEPGSETSFTLILATTPIIHSNYTSSSSFLLQG